MMKQLISGFPNQLQEALEISRSAQLKPFSGKINNVLICGLGGSGIGGIVVIKSISKKVSVPVLNCSDYHIPAFVGPDTLVIASTYSGNTEETLSAVNKAKDKGAEIAFITSGGMALEMANEFGLNKIIVPNGNPPRTCIGYSMTQLFTLLTHYGLIETTFLEEIAKGRELIIEDQENIHNKAKEIASKLEGKTPVIYSSDNYECVAIRFRQQLNENSKMLAWHHKFPELNHNEIVGWAEERKDVAVVFLRNEDDFYRTSERMNFTRDNVVGKYAASVSEIYSKGDTYLQRALYLINLVDWVSYYIAENKAIDPVEIRVIDALKAHLSTIA